MIKSPIDTNYCSSDNIKPGSGWLHVSVSVTITTFKWNEFFFRTGPFLFVWQTIRRDQSKICKIRFIES